MCRHAGWSWCSVLFLYLKRLGKVQKNGLELNNKIEQGTHAVKVQLKGWMSTCCLAACFVLTAAEQPDHSTTSCAARPSALAPRLQVKGQPGEKELLVRVLDVPSLTWSVLQPSSAAPPARGGHSVRRLLMHNEVDEWVNVAIMAHPLAS